VAGVEKENDRVPQLIDSPLSAAPETFLLREKLYGLPLLNDRLTKNVARGADVEDSAEL